MKKSQRLEYLDIARSLGLFLVVWGHHVQQPICQFVYSFHIPLFFFISGVAYTIKRENSFIAFTIKKAKRLLIPYFFFSAILFAKWLIFGLAQNELNDTTVILRNFFGIFYAQGGRKFMDWGVPMWFLPCLFLSNVFYWVIEKINSIFIRSIMIFSFFLIFMNLEKFNILFPWSIDAAFIGLFYFHLGVLYNTYIKKSLPSIINIPLLICCLALTWIFAFKTNRLDLYFHSSGIIGYHFISSIMGIYFIVLLSKQLEKLNFINLISKHSIPILAFHTTVGGYLLIAIKLLTGFSKNNAYLSFIYSTLQIGIIIIVCAIVNLFHAKIMEMKYKRDDRMIA